MSNSSREATPGLGPVADEVEWWVDLVEKGPGPGAMTELFGDGLVVPEDPGIVLGPLRPEFAVVPGASR